MGGWHNGHLCDVVIIDTAQGTAERVVQQDPELGFQCRSPAVMVEEGTVLALVADKDEILKFVRYSTYDNKLQFVQTIGTWKLE